MIEYRVDEPAITTFDELKKAIPKLLSATFLGGELISIHTTEELTPAELAEIEKAFGVKLRKVG